MLYTIKQRQNCQNLAEKFETFSKNYQVCIKSKHIAKQQLHPPLKKIYDPRIGPEDLLEIDLARPIPASNGFSHILTAVELFSRHMFPTPLRQPDEPSVVKRLKSILARHWFVPNTILTDKRTAVTAEVMQRTMEQAEITIKHATVKYAKTIGMMERNLQK